MPKEITAKSVLNKTKKRDSWFLDDYTFNPYSSCSFNCLYCYIRGSKYGTNLEKSVAIKINAIELLDKQLANRAKKKQFGIIVLSSVTDPYMHIEEKYKMTRKALKVILKHRFPVHVITKSDLIQRDYDILKKIEQQAILPDDLKMLTKGVIVSFSFSTLDDGVAKIFESGATQPTKRIQALHNTLAQGFLTGVNLMPLIPHISDTAEQLDVAFTTFKKIGVDYILPATITLFGQHKADSKTRVLNAIAQYYPHLLEKYQRFFANSHQLPYRYRKAFDEKIKALCHQYQLNNSIINAAIKKHKTSHENG